MHFGYSPPRDDPTPEQIESWTRRTNPPDNEVPGAVPWSVLLGRNTDVAVALAGASAYSTGIRLGVAVRVRQGSRRGDVDLHHQVFGYSDGGVDRLLIGVEYADGRVATNSTQDSWSPQEQPDDEPSLHPGAASGGPYGIDVELFLSPLPPAGPLTIFCAWPSRGIPESRTVLDGAALAEAVTRIQVLWPVKVDPPPAPAQSPPPNVPQGGWFEAILRPNPQQ